MDLLWTLACAGASHLQLFLGQEERAGWGKTRRNHCTLSFLPHQGPFPSTRAKGMFRLICANRYLCACITTHTHKDQNTLSRRGLGKHQGLLC